MLARDVLGGLEAEHPRRLANMQCRRQVGSLHEAVGLVRDVRRSIECAHLNSFRSQRRRVAALARAKLDDGSAANESLELAHKPSVHKVDVRLGQLPRACLAWHGASLRPLRALYGVVAAHADRPAERHLADGLKARPRVQLMRACLELLAQPLSAAVQSEGPSGELLYALAQRIDLRLALRDARTQHVALSFERFRSLRKACDRGSVGEYCSWPLSSGKHTRRSRPP
mmetsp:Transcript_36274/g.84743  ORF Transcript_36274/g.84743 Transcript_36274/m.84743 type:complete len:228 (+) Transcript_36274:673-1356(+)